MSNAAGTFIDPSLKRCGRCAQTLPVERFRLRTQAGREHKRYSICADCWTLKSREWLANNRERANALNRAWFAKDPARTREIYRAAQKRRLANPINRLHSRVSNQVWLALRGKKSGRTTASLLGYSFAELHVHLERLFTEGMNWENIGEWHIDHIMPLSSFTITGPDDPQLRVAWALSNLQPLWAKDNLAKGARLDHPYSLARSP